MGRVLEIVARWRQAARPPVLLVLLGLAVYGFFHEHLLSQPLWSPDGRERFLLYTVVYWAAAGLVLWKAPRWIGVIAAAAMLLYATPLAVLYLFGSCFLLGRILHRDAEVPTSILLGMAVWIFVFWIALHFPLNTRLTYAAALAIPYAWEFRRWREHARGWRVLCASRGEAAGLAVLLYLLIALFLLALKPEASYDGLSMHLALPMAVAHDGRWAFDFHHYTWALMPAGGDVFFTAAYLLGGETAARLANFAVLLVIAAMVSRGKSFLGAALFVSTPLVALVTGSLFVENVWAAMIVGGVLAVVRYVEKKDPAELRIAGILFGGSLAGKLIAAVFVAPAAAVAGWCAFRRRNVPGLAIAALVLVVLAAPPYVYAFARTGNPIFPFANTIFRSPYFNSTTPFTDPRFAAPLSWRTPYDVTFRTSAYFEGEPGSAGFQYFLLLLPAALLLRKRDQWLLFAMGAVPAVILLAALPNLRYLYPALPLFSMIIDAPAAAYVGLAALNLWFLPSMGFHQEFALFTNAQKTAYTEKIWPEHALIEHLNRTAPGEPVAFFSCGSVAGLNAIPYVDDWHSSEYFDRIGRARTAAEIASILRELGVRHLIAPLNMQSARPLFETFLRQWAGPPENTSGRLALFRLRESPVIVTRDLPVLPPGSWDDLDARIEYTGAWIHDPQFRQALNGSVTYSDVAGDSIGVSFNGSALTWIFTKAVNRGIAAVVIDGAERARVDLYSPDTHWRSMQSFTTGPGKHSLELRVTGEKNPASSGTYVDLDTIVVIP